MEYFIFKPFTCGSCIYCNHSYNNNYCVAQSTWKEVDIFQKCDINLWSGFDLE